MSQVKNCITLKYPAKQFIDTDNSSALIDVIEQNPLATLFYLEEGTMPQISHIPFHFEEAVLNNMKEHALDSLIDVQLMAHVSNQHPLAQRIKTLKTNKNTPKKITKETTKGENTITLIFHGEDEYISPNDVSSEYSSQQKVPTWNYAKVHVSGYVDEITNVDDKYQQMVKTSDYFEQIKVQQGLTSPEKNTLWSLAPNNPGEYINTGEHKNNSSEQDTIKQMLKAITVFKLTITSIEGQFKLSQNKQASIREQIAEQVARRRKFVLAKQIRTLTHTF